MAKVRELVIGKIDEIISNEPNFKPPQKPWKNMLPECLPMGILYCDDTVTTSSEADFMHLIEEQIKLDRGWKTLDWKNGILQPVIGLVDRPTRAEQFPLQLDLAHTHVALFGAPGTGKTTFLRTVILSLVSTYSPDALHIYAIDLSAGGLSVFDKLPHVAALLTASTPEVDELIARLFRRLNDELSTRRQALKTARVDNIYAHNAQQPHHTIPGLVVTIDNFARFRDQYEPYVDMLTSIAREGGAYGIHLIVTAEQTNALPSKLYNQFSQRLTLRLNDPGEYASVLGRNVPPLPDVPGRGYLINNRSILEFQTAIPVGEFRQLHLPDEAIEDADDDVSRLYAFSDRINTFWGTRSRPAPITTLPTSVTLGHVFSSLPEDAEGLPIGLRDRDLQPASLHLTDRKPHLLIAGAPFSGKSIALHTIAFSIANRYSPSQAQIAWVDFQQPTANANQNGTWPFFQIPHLLQSATNVEQISELATLLQTKLTTGSELPSEIFLLIDNYDVVVQKTTEAKSAAIKDITDLARQHKGLHIILTLPTHQLTRMSGDDLLKHVQAGRHMLALDMPAAEYFGVKVAKNNKYSFVGRSYIIFANQSSLIQIAIPQFLSDHPTPDSESILNHNHGENNIASED